MIFKISEKSNLRKIESPKNRILRKIEFSEISNSPKYRISEIGKVDRLKTFLNQFRFPIAVQIGIFRIVIEFNQILNEF